MIGHDAREALAGTELTDEERDAFVRWDARRLNELGGSLHLSSRSPASAGIDLRFRGEQDRAMNSDCRPSSGLLVVNYEIHAR
jgi:hypothetical protein